MSRDCSVCGGGVEHPDGTFTMCEDCEDARIVEERREAVARGEEEMHDWEDVKRELGLSEGDGVLEALVEQARAKWRKAQEAEWERMAGRFEKERAALADALPKEVWQAMGIEIASLSLADDFDFETLHIRSLFAVHDVPLEVEIHVREESIALRILDPETGMILTNPRRLAYPAEARRVEINTGIIGEMLALALVEVTRVEVPH